MSIPALVSIPVSIPGEYPRLSRGRPGIDSPSGRRISTFPRTGVAFHYGITSDPLGINFISPYSNKDWSKFDPGSAIDRILFELVEREFKAVYVIRNCSSSY